MDDSTSVIKIVSRLIVRECMIAIDVYPVLAFLGSLTFDGNSSFSRVKKLTEASFNFRQLRLVDLFFSFAFVLRILPNH